MLVSPTTPTTAFPIGERADDPMAMYLADLCTIPSNLAGNAALSVPCGLADEDGLPVGLQIMAPVLGDDRCYRVGAAVERAFESRWGGRCCPRLRPGDPGETGKEGGMITRIEIDGFKSFLNFELDVPPLLALIGPNASGKSNFFDALTFLS